MITVAGEALIDLVIDGSGSVTAVPGGAPFNVARMIARLGADCQFLGRLSDDGFGEQLRASLVQDGVRIAVPEPTPAPTTLAIARLDDLGAAEYKFYLEQTSAAELTSADIRVRDPRRLERDRVGRPGAAGRADGVEPDRADSAAATRGDDPARP